MASMPMHPPLNSTELECLSELKKVFLNSDPNAPSPNEDKSPLLDPEDKNFLTESTLMCFTRARDGNLAKAKAMLLECCAWRKSYRPFAIHCDHIKTALCQTTMIISGVDTKNDNRPIVVMTLGVPNVCEVEERVKQLVYILESTMQCGYRQLTWVIDFSERGKHPADSRSKTTQKETMKILQNYYPERLGALYMFRPPWYFSILFTLVSPFMDRRTREKIVKLPNISQEDLTNVEKNELLKYLDRDQLPVRQGGTVEDDGYTTAKRIVAPDTQEVEPKAEE